MIPFKLIQTSVNKPATRITEKLKPYILGYEYIHFNDFEAIKFFRQYPDEEFKDIIDLYFDFELGQHKADLFRYYYLYKLGGVFLDSDAMLYTQLQGKVLTCDFFTVVSNNDMTFQGFIGCIPKHEIMYKALKHCYSSTKYERENYHVFCKYLRTVIDDYPKKDRIKLFVELRHEEGDNPKIVDEYNNTILVHYINEKSIPL